MNKIEEEIKKTKEILLHTEVKDLFSKGFINELFELKILIEDFFNVLSPSVKPMNIKEKKNG